MAISSSDMADTTCADMPMHQTAATGSAGTSGAPRQDPRQMTGTTQKSNPHLTKQHGFINHKQPAGRK